MVAWASGNGHLAAILAFYGAFFSSTRSLLLHDREGQVEVWQEILDDLQLRGDERVLDMGCGRGAVRPPLPEG